MRDQNLCFFSLFFFSILYSPQTPPSTYRRQVDIQYNSLPRASFTSTNNVPIQSTSPSLNNGGIRGQSSSTNSSISTTDSNANPKQRNVAFGKQLNNLQYLPYSASKSATNIYHHQLVLYQQTPEPTQSSIPSQAQPLCDSFQKQRGVSVPNLGLFSVVLITFYYRQALVLLFLIINTFSFLFVFFNSIVFLFFFFLIALDTRLTYHLI